MTGGSYVSLEVQNCHSWLLYQSIPTLELLSSASSIESKPGDGDVAPAPAPENAAAANNSNSYHHPPVNSVHAPPINSAHVNSLKVGRRTNICSDTVGNKTNMTSDIFLNFDPN